MGEGPAIHTSVAKRIHHLISLLLIIQLPSLLKGAGRLGPGLRLRIPPIKIEAVEHEDEGDTQILVRLELPLDVGLERERKTTQGDEKRFTSGVVVKVLVDVVRRIDSDHSALESGEGEGHRTADGPVVQSADCLHDEDG